MYFFVEINFSMFYNMYAYKERICCARNKHKRSNSFITTVFMRTKSVFYGDMGSKLIGPLSNFELILTVAPVKISLEIHSRRKYLVDYNVHKATASANLMHDRPV